MDAGLLRDGGIRHLRLGRSVTRLQASPMTAVCFRRGPSRGRRGRSKKAMPDDPFDAMDEQARDYL